MPFTFDNTNNTILFNDNTLVTSINTIENNKNLGLRNRGLIHTANKASSSNTGAVQAANRIYLSPILIQSNVMIESININVSTSSSGGTINLLLYDNIDGLPTNLIFNGTVSSNTTGIKQINIGKFFNAGWYWVGIQMSDTTMRVLSNGTSTGFSVMHYLGKFVINSFIDKSIYLDSSDMTFPSNIIDILFESNLMFAVSLRVNSYGFEFNNGNISFNSANLTTTYPDYHPGFVSGKYYPSNVITNTSTTTTVINSQINFSPFIISNNLNITSIATEVTTGTAQNLRLGLYSSDTNGFPNSLVFNSGLISTNPAGIKISLNSASLTPGIYWMALRTSGNVSIRASNLNLNFMSMNPSVSNFRCDTIRCTSLPPDSNATLPSIFTTETFDYTATTIPLVWLGV